MPLKFGMWETALMVFLVALAIVVASGPKLIRKIKSRGCVGRDANKPGKPQVAEMGGIAIALGYAVALLLSLQLFNAINASLMLASILTVVMVSYLGFVDDVLSLRDRYRVLLPLFAALPLMVVKAGTTTMLIPFIGHVNFNFGTLFLPVLGTTITMNLYALLLIPIGVVAASNLINLLAGFNGLEAGIGVIVSAALALAALLSGAPPEALFLAVAMAGACLGFLFFNWYPARIFPGNITTYAIGANVAAIVIIGNMERVGVIALMPQIMEFFLKARTGFQAENFGKVGRDGRLSYAGTTSSLTHLVMKKFRPTEQQLVLMLLALQAVFGIIAVASMYA